MPEFLTTKELAELLRIKERKVYDLAASGEVPCSRATGKLLFPTAAVKEWIIKSGSGYHTATAHNRANVILGSHDPLLEWAIRESRCGIATFFDGSADGLKRFVDCEGIATGLHLYDPQGDNWNTQAVSQLAGKHPAVLIEWAQRQRGLIISDNSRKSITCISDLKGHRFTPRQQEAGAQLLFLHLLGKQDITADEITFTDTARSENDAALAVLEGKSDASFGLASLAEQYRLDFIPVVEERFDLLVDRRAWFEPPMQTLMNFCQSEPFCIRARELAGYDTSHMGQVHYNGPAS